MKWEGFDKNPKRRKLREEVTRVRLSTREIGKLDFVEYICAGVGETLICSLGR